MTKLANLLALFVLVFLEFAHAKTPVVLIPGLAGSWLEGRRSRGTWFCPTQPKYVPLWPNFNNSDWLCWEFDITVQYNKNTRKFVNYTDTGMEVRVVDWSGVSGILNVTLEGFYYPYYQDIVSNLTKVYGYKVYQDLFGAPFDWRLSPQSLGQYFIDLKALIQHAYSLNNAQVVVVAHSYGNLIFSQFLKGQSEAWKRVYIKEYLALSGPFLGSAEALAGAVFGIIGGFPAFPLHEVLETFPSLYYLSPSVHAINPVFDKLLFNISHLHSTRPPIHYYVDRPSYRALMSYTYLSIDWDEYEIWNNEQFEPRFNPGVKVSCYYGTQVPTAQSYNVTLYGTTTVDFSSYDRDGDGVVLSNSGDYCKNWPNTRAYPVAKASHLGILQTADILKAIVTAISN